MMDDLLPSGTTANGENSFHPAEDEDTGAGDMNKEVDGGDGGDSGEDLNEHDVSKL
jgi:hypothetical protein